MPRPKSLTTGRLAAAALAVLDREGLAALSMRAVAAELGVAPMSLYRYVADRAELERLTVDLVLGAVDLTPPPGEDWEGQVTALVERMRAAVAEHPEIVPLSLTHRHSAAGVLRWAEAALGVLTGAGFEGRRRVLALRALLSYLVGALLSERLGPLTGPGTEAMAALPAETFPLLAGTAAEARGVGPEEEFRGGLALLLRGLRQDLTR
ncbi:TetR/AcrR family transcriptional regulator [Streptomyces hoynatensis]|uniref:TetR family transcriptional regulator n=1 Tax=Streptomyces hoynatensis TaxID=1141874 RepID=A0A3A9YD95_9ACTN|nr:TetR/AcrR family transcriptional regulator C-terminal domain-containing protein [Streptomyces hoynatensis]RKN35158.1 TetR family transcriptional regulator [Streptomyces hoynatensis]